jgi:hypothetical protein
LWDAFEIMPVDVRTRESRFVAALGMEARKANAEANLKAVMAPRVRNGVG